MVVLLFVALCLFCVFVLAALLYGAGLYDGAAMIVGLIVGVLAVPLIFFVRRLIRGY